MTSPSPISVPSDGVSHTITLRDGRKLGYAEYGLATGTPILYFMGVPASRYEGSLWHETAEKCQARLISIERPGIGLSSPKPQRTVTSFADDVLELADQLQLSAFRILAVSGGGPYGLACTKALPSIRLKATTLVAGFGPLKWTGTSGMGWTSKVTFSLLSWTPALLRPLINWTMVPAAHDANPDVFREVMLKGMMSSMPAPDQAVLSAEDQSVARGLETSIREAFKNGGEGVAMEGRLLSSNWDFEVKDVPAENMIVWYGTADTNCPPVMSERLVKELGEAVEVKVKEGEGHLSIEIHHADEIIRTLLQKGH